MKKLLCFLGAHKWRQVVEYADPHFGGLSQRRICYWCYRVETRHTFPGKAADVNREGFVNGGGRVYWTGWMGGY